MVTGFAAVIKNESMPVWGTGGVKRQKSSMDTLRLRPYCLPPAADAIYVCCRGRFRGSLESRRLQLRVIRPDTGMKNGFGRNK